MVCFFFNKKLKAKHEKMKFSSVEMERESVTSNMRTRTFSAEELEGEPSRDCGGIHSR